MDLLLLLMVLAIAWSVVVLKRHSHSTDLDKICRSFKVLCNYHMILLVLCYHLQCHRLLSDHDKVFSGLFTGHSRAKGLIVGLWLQNLSISMILFYGSNP